MVIDIGWVCTILSVRPMGHHYFVYLYYNFGTIPGFDREPYSLPEGYVFDFHILNERLYRNLEEYKAETL